MMHTCGGQRGGGGEGKQGGEGRQQGGGRTVLRQNCFHLSHGNQQALSLAHVQPADLHHGGAGEEGLPARHAGADLRDDADRVMRTAMSKLFREEPDVRELIKLKAIY